MAGFARRALDQLIVLRPGEGRSVTLMFAYSFLATTSYNLLKPITRSKFITSFGAHNLPWVMLAASRHLRVISLVIGLAAAGAAIVEQQVNMVAEATGASEDAPCASTASRSIRCSAITSN